MALNGKHPLPKYETYGGSLFPLFVFCATTIVWLLDNAALLPRAAFVVHEGFFRPSHCSTNIFLCHFCSYRSGLRWSQRILNGEWRAHAGEPLCLPARATPSSQLSPLLLLAHRPCALSQGLYHWKLVKGGGAGGWEQWGGGQSGEMRTCSKRTPQQMQRENCFFHHAFFSSSMCFPNTFGQQTKHTVSVLGCWGIAKKHGVRRTEAFHQ